MLLDTSSSFFSSQSFKDFKRSLNSKQSLEMTDQSKLSRLGRMRMMHCLEQELLFLMMPNSVNALSMGRKSLNCRTQLAMHDLEYFLTEDFGWAVFRTSGCRMCSLRSAYRWSGATQDIFENISQIARIDSSNVASLRSYSFN